LCNYQDSKGIKRVFRNFLLRAPAKLALLFACTILLITFTRLPLFPKQLFSFDSANLAFALHEFDPSRSQPQPPGYPFFVAEARFLYWLLGTPELTFAIQACIIGGLALGMLYLLGRRMLNPSAGLAGAALFFVNPVFWFSGLTSPLRLHLALVCILVAYFCWRAITENPKYFYAASIVLGLGGGFRPEIVLLLLPLWLYTGAQGKYRWGRLLRGAILLASCSLIWVLVLMAAMGGLAPMRALFSAYLFSQTTPTSVFTNPRSGSWVRWAGRAVLWNGLGIIPWIWAGPLGWLRRHELGQWVRIIAFLAVWFFPPFLFYLFVHVNDPEHILTIIPVLCLAGGFCLSCAEEGFARRFPDWKNARGLVIGTALVANTTLFLVHFPLPQREASTSFRGLQSVADAIRIGTYETSYKYIVDSSVQTEAALKQIKKLTRETDRPVLILWSMYAEPVWRKVCFYFPSEKVYALYEDRGPGASGTRAQLWSGTKLLASSTGTPPYILPVPKGARMIWLLNPNSVNELRKIVPLSESMPIHYTDLPADAPDFRWGSFAFTTKDPRSQTPEPGMAP
jgi:4-amino-4-deoxy-L-arabinose transferase-like glycosyltransferase